MNHSSPLLYSKYLVCHEINVNSPRDLKLVSAKIEFKICENGINLISFSPSYAFCSDASLRERLSVYSLFVVKEGLCV